LGGACWLARRLLLLKTVTAENRGKSGQIGANRGNAGTADRTAQNKLKRCRFYNSSRCKSAAM